MKTERLIEALVADHAAHRGGKLAQWRLGAALALGGLASLVLFVIAFGARDDIAAALATWRFDLKVGLVLLALVLAFSLCRALARPTASARAVRLLWPLAAATGAAVALELATTPSGSWAARLVGSNSVVCLTVVPILSFAPLAALLAALRAGAPASPALAGGAAGLAAAATGALLYAFHCADNSPLFVVTWYSLAAIPVIGLGALVGHRLLRW